MTPIDIFITAYERKEITQQTLEYLYERTKTPFRVWLLDQGMTNAEMWVQNNGKFPGLMYVGLEQNLGIHAAWNMALALAESEYFITSDNDIFVPDLVNYAQSATMTDDNPEGPYSKIELILDPDRHRDPNPDWLSRLFTLMNQQQQYGAISLHPHVFIGAANVDPTVSEDVVERNMCGAVMRIMRREAVYKAGGWEHKIEAGRNHEERTICSRLQTAGYKVGITPRIRAFHPFPPNWGYPKEFTPEMQKHNPDLEAYVQQFGNMNNYDQKTWMPK